MDKIVKVVAALLKKSDKFLICQRPKDKARGLLWEFVGGKVEKDESKEQALIRECKEELDISVTPVREFCKVVHEYPDLTIELTLFEATTEDEPKLLEHNDCRWITANETDDYEFCPADVDIIKKIKEELNV